MYMIVTHNLHNIYREVRLSSLWCSDTVGWLEERHPACKNTCTIYHKDSFSE